MALQLLLVTLASCAAIPQDLTSKMFTFPEETNTAHVKLLKTKQDLSAVTVCLRSFTDLRRPHKIFSFGTESASSYFRLIKNAEGELLFFWGRDKKVEYTLQDYKLNEWNEICTTWDATSGLIQLWINKKHSSRKFISSGSNITGPIILGQVQDFIHEGFNEQLSFVGMMSYVHMWDYAIGYYELFRYFENIAPGNVLSWNAVDFEITGRVLIEKIRLY